MSPRRELEIFFGPDHTATIRPAPEGCVPRTTQQSVKVIPHSPWPDHVAYLTAKQLDVINWAQAGYSPVIAKHIKDFLLHNDVRALSTLTNKEIGELREKLQATNEKGARKAERLPRRVK